MLSCCGTARLPRPLREAGVERGIFSKSLGRDEGFGAPIVILLIAEIRRQLIEQDTVDYMIALPGQLFYTTQIPVCLWFLARNKKNGKFRDRRGETLFIDARKLGALVNRTHRELADDEIGRIAKTYHAWRGEKDADKYADSAGFCKSASLEETTSHGHVLTPGRYVGAEETEVDDDMPFEERMEQLTAKLKGQFQESAKIEKAILKNLASLGFTGKEST